MIKLKAKTDLIAGMENSIAFVAAVFLSMQFFILNKSQKMNSKLYVDVIQGEDDILPRCSCVSL